MTTEHTVVRSGKSKRKPFNSNAADYLLIIATFTFSYITSTNCTCTDDRWSRLKLRTSAPGLSHSEEPRADSHSVTARSRSWSGNNVRRVGRNSPPRLDRRLEFGHEPTRDTAHSLSSRVTYSVDSEVYQDAALDGVPEDLVAGLMEKAERDFRRGLAQELITAERATDDGIAAEIDKFKP